MGFAEVQKASFGMKKKPITYFYLQETLFERNLIKD
jgi:hypothetical protein